MHCVCNLVINSTKSLKTVSLEVSEENISAIHTLDTLSGDFQVMQKLLLRHCLTSVDEELAVVREKIDTTISEVEQVAEQYKAWIADGEEKKLYEQFIELYGQLNELYMQSVRDSEDQEKGDAIARANGEIAEVSNQMEEIIDQMIAHRQDSAEKSIQQQSETFNQSMTLNFIMIILAIVISILALVSCYITIVSPTKKSIKALRVFIKKMENNQCDLNERIPVKTKDEIGQLVGGMNSFLDTLKNVIGGISHGSNNLEEAITGVTESISSVNVSSKNISDVMDRLSASMEEVSVTISNINQNVSEVGESVSGFSETCGEVLDYSKTMQERADGLEKMAIESQNVTGKMVGEMIEGLRVAIEHSKSVEQVESLTNDILSISSQTNLLALNASIEAARAGSRKRLCRCG